MTTVSGSDSGKRIVKQGGAGGIWFLGFLGALVYYIHFHSGHVLDSGGRLPQIPGMASLCGVPRPPTEALRRNA